MRELMWAAVGAVVWFAACFSFRPRSDSDLLVLTLVVATPTALTLFAMLKHRPGPRGERINPPDPVERFFAWMHGGTWERVLWTGVALAWGVLLMGDGASGRYRRDGYTKADVVWLGAALIFARSAAYLLPRVRAIAPTTKSQPPSTAFLLAGAGLLTCVLAFAIAFGKARALFD